MSTTVFYKNGSSFYAHFLSRNLSIIFRVLILNNSSTVLLIEEHAEKLTSWLGTKLNFLFLPQKEFLKTTLSFAKTHIYSLRSKTLEKLFQYSYLL